MTGRVLSAGAVTARLEGAQLLDVRVASRLLVRRIGLAVRDDRWGTLPLTVERLEATDDGALVAGTACRDGLELTWDVRFAVGRGREVSAECELRAVRPGRTNRAGLVILLDPALACGARASWDGAGGSGSARLPELVAPQVLDDGHPQPLLGPFEHIELLLADGSTVRGSFPTVSFELEDQRNWTDGSFKLYGPPLVLGFPRKLREGEVLRQRVALELTAASGGTRAVPLDTRLRVGARVGVVPAVGVRLETDGSLAAAEAVGRLRPAHVRIDAGASGPDKALRERAGRTGAPLELALHLAAEAPRGLAALLAELEPLRVLVLGAASCTPPKLVAEVASVAGCAVGGGTDGDFADLNRARPAAGVWDGLVVPMCPQVHGRDDDTIRGALAGLPAILATARYTMAPKRIFVSPMSMTPRSGPGSAPGDSTMEEARDRMARPDTAAWLLAALGRLGAAGGLVASVTAFADAGPDGLFDERTAAPLPAAGVVEALAGLAGRPLLAVAGLPGQVEGFATEAPDGDRTAWLANLGPGVARVRVTGPARVVAGEHDARPGVVVLAVGAVVAVELPNDAVAPAGGAS